MVLPLLRKAVILAAVLLLFAWFSYLFFPVARLDTVVASLLSQQRLTLAPSPRKTILPGLVWDDLLLSSEQGGLIHCDRLKIRVQLLPLIAGRAVIAGVAKIGNGYIDVSYATNGKQALRLGAEGISLAELPVFKSILGAKASGNLWSKGVLQRSTKGMNGEVKLEVKQLEFSGVRLGSFSLPDAAGLKAQGMVLVSDGKARLESFTLEGEGLYMRLSGDLPLGGNVATEPLNLTLEIMPKPDFLEKQKLVFMLLAKFMTAPGVYSVPIRGTFLKPAIL